MAPVDLCWQGLFQVADRLLFDQRSDQRKAVGGQALAVLRYGVQTQRQTIKQVVIIETAQVDIRIHQLVLIQVA